MDIQLTNDADKMVCQLYKLYLEKRKSGVNKDNSRHFSFSEIKAIKSYANWSDSDIKDTVAEIKRANLGTMFLDGGFLANDTFIFYMENRFKNGFNEVVDFISKFIP